MKHTQHTDRLNSNMLQLVEQASKKFVCIVDESKLVDGLGGSKGQCSFGISRCPTALRKLAAVCITIHCYLALQLLLAGN